MTIKTIYDLPTVHHLEARHIYEREVEGDPSLSQFLSPSLEPEHRLKRKEEELALLGTMPDDEVARPGMRITIRVAFTRDGTILGEPRFTFSTPGVSPEVRAVYQRAVVDMLNRCTPLPITRELGDAIAGRPFVIPIVETRKEKKAEIAP